jgi:hypothetical protein
MGQWQDLSNPRRNISILNGIKKEPVKDVVGYRENLLSHIMVKYENNKKSREMDNTGMAPKWA